MLIPQTSVAEEKLFRLFIFQLKPQILLFSVLVTYSMDSLLTPKSVLGSLDIKVIESSLPLTQRLELCGEGGSYFLRFSSGGYISEVTTPDLDTGPHSDFRSYLLFSP